MVSRKTEHTRFVGHAATIRFGLLVASLPQTANCLHWRFSVLQIASKSYELHVLRHGLFWLHLLLFLHLRKSVLVQVAQKGIGSDFLFILVLPPNEISISVKVTYTLTKHQRSTVLVLLLQIETGDAVHVLINISFLYMTTEDSIYIQIEARVLVVILSVDVLDCFPGSHHLRFTV